VWLGNQDFLKKWGKKIQSKMAEPLLPATVGDCFIAMGGGGHDRR